MWGFVSRLTPSGVNRMVLVYSGSLQIPGGCVGCKPGCVVALGVLLKHD